MFSVLALLFCDGVLMFLRWCFGVFIVVFSAGVLMFLRRRLCGDGLAVDVMFLWRCCFSASATVFVVARWLLMVLLLSRCFLWVF